MEGKTFENIPQVGTGTAGESHSFAKKDCPTDSGEGILPCKKDQYEKQGTQRPQEETTDGGDYQSPFTRRDSIPRSPPMLRRFQDEITRQRSGSCSSISSHTTESNASKRKRGEELTESSSQGDLQEFSDLIKKLKEDASAMNTEVEKTYKPKKEFKNLTSSILLWTRELERKIQDVLNKGARNWGDIPGDKKASDQEVEEQLRRENQSLRTQIQAMGTSQKRELIENIPIKDGVQCEECKKAQRKEARKRILARNDNFENYQEVTEEDWKDEIFPKIKTERGCIWEVPNDYALVLPCNKNIEASHREIGTAIEKFGGIEGLRRQNKQKGEVAMMTHSLGFPDSDGNYTHMSRDIYYPILFEEKAREAADDKAMFQSLKIIKMHMLKYDKRKLAITEIDDITGLVIGRMIEFLFADTNIEITLYKQNNDQGENRSNTLGKNKQSIGKGNEHLVARPKKSKQDALLIRMQGKQYADMLKTVRSSINLNEIGVDIKEIKKTKSGELLLTVKNGIEKAEILKNKIKEKIPEATTSVLRNTRVLHIRDLDEVVTQEEITEAISKAIPIKPGALDVRALRPAYGNRQNVTLVVPEAEAQILIQMGKIKIGWTNCRIVERKKEERCYRCWQYGHTKTNCNGPNRESLCLKCSQEGHKAADCKNSPFCVHCNQDGHQTGNPKCPKSNKRKIAEVSTRPTQNPI